MNTVQRIAKNTAALFASLFVVSILSLILSILIARMLGDVAFGKYTFALAFTAIFAIFSDLGYNTLLIREVARDKSQASKYLNNILGIRALLSFIIFVFIAITINLMAYPEDTKNIVYFLSVYTFINSFSAVFKTTFRAFEKMEYEAITTIFANTIKVSLGLVVLLLGYGLIDLVLAFIFSAILDVILSFYVCKKKFLKPKIELDPNFLRRSIGIALPLSMLSIFGFIYVHIDTVMLSMMKGDAVVGWYNAAYNLVLGFKPVSQLFMNALFPLISGCFVSSKDTLRIIYEKAFKYLFILGLPIALGIILLADRIILLLYNEQFYPSIIALQILSLDVLLIFLYVCSAFILISINKHSQMAVIACSAALLNIILNLFLIPSFSYIGSAIATIMAESSLLIAYMYLCSRYSYSLSLRNIITKPVGAGVAMGLFLYQFRSLNLFLEIFGAIIVYFGSLYLLKGFSKEDVSLFKKLLKR